MMATPFLLRENIGTTFNDINQSKILYDPVPRVMEIRTKINKWDLIKLKSFCTAKETTNRVKRQNDRILKKELPKSVGAQYATGDQWRNNSRKNEGMEPKQKQYPLVDVTGDRSKV